MPTIRSNRRSNKNNTIFAIAFITVISQVDVGYSRLYNNKLTGLPDPPAPLSPLAPPWC